MLLEVKETFDGNEAVFTLGVFYVQWLLPIVLFRQERQGIPFKDGLDAFIFPSVQ